MSERYRARVEWVFAEEGGRQSPPHSTRYITISRFPEDGPGWPDGAWSIVVEFDEPPSTSKSPSYGTVRFLMNTAPHERLYPGAEFTLYEGLSRVARVAVGNRVN